MHGSGARQLPLTKATVILRKYWDYNMREMSILQVLEKYNLDKSLIFGYYGGGNFGDELLLEVLQNLLRHHRDQYL